MSHDHVSRSRSTLMQQQACTHANDSNPRAEYHLLSRNLRMAATVAAGCSSISQCPEFGITTDITSVATKWRMSAIVVPNDLSPPIANTGMDSLPLAANAWLSIASCVNAANWLNAARIAPGRA